VAWPPPRCDRRPDIQPVKQVQSTLTFELQQEAYSSPGRGWWEAPELPDRLGGLTHTPHRGERGARSVRGRFGMALEERQPVTDPRNVVRGGVGRVRAARGTANRDTSLVPTFPSVAARRACWDPWGRRRAVARKVLGLP
jgi:hypothetical protein